MWGACEGEFLICISMIIWKKTFYVISFKFFENLEQIKKNLAFCSAEN